MVINIKLRDNGDGAFRIGVRHADPETARRINVEQKEAILKAQAGVSLFDAAPPSNRCTAL